MLQRIIKLALSLVLILSIFACHTTQSTSDEDKKISTAKINTQLGIAYLERNDVQRAKRKLLIALDQAPTIPDTWYTMGYFLEATGERDEAKRYYLKAVKIAPNRGDVQNNYGTFLCRSGEYNEAIKHFELAAKDINHVDIASSYENAGLCALKIPDKKLAMYYFDKSIQQNPDHASVYLEIAKIHYENSNYQFAKNNLIRFSNLSPPTKESIDLSDQLHAKLGNAFPIGEM